MSQTNDELCERILPYGEHHWKEVEIKSVVDACREDLKQALTSGLLIPAEKMLTAEEIAEAVKFGIQTYHPDYCTEGKSVYIAKAIHQSSRQKAGVK